MSGNNNPEQEFNWLELHEKMNNLCNALDVKLDKARLDAILAERAEQLANVTESEEITDNIDVLIFELGEEQYAIDTAYVTEVIPLKLLTRVPGAPDFILGVVSRRGEIVSVIDLACFMNLTKSEQCNSLIFVEHQRQQVGIAVEQLKEIAQISQNSIQQLHAQLPGEQGHYLAGVTETGIALLNVSEMLTSDRLNIDLL